MRDRKQIEYLIEVTLIGIMYIPELRENESREIIRRDIRVILQDLYRTATAPIIEELEASMRHRSEMDTFWNDVTNKYMRRMESMKEQIGVKRYELSSDKKGLKVYFSENDWYHIHSAELTEEEHITHSKLIKSHSGISMMDTTAALESSAHQ